MWFCIRYKETARESNLHVVEVLRSLVEYALRSKVRPCRIEPESELLELAIDQLRESGIGLHVERAADEAFGCDAFLASASPVPG